MMNLSPKVERLRAPILLPRFPRPSIANFRNSFVTLILLGLMSLSIGARAQDVTVTGTVSDGKTGGMPGVTITQKGTTKGTNSDVDGKYQIVVPANSIISFSSIGYVTQEINVGNKSVIDVVLAEDTKALEEIVVVGYGTAKRKDVTGTVSSISSKDFNAGVNPNPMQAIQGRVAGLTITQPNGDPNSTPTVRLRGYTSLTGSGEPLYVIDGIVGGSVSNMSPNDIETMDVLKDASAAAIYGSRAANGVIIVTTKRGKSGKGTVTFNNYISADVISRNLDMLNSAEYVGEVKRILGDGSLTDNLKFPKDANGKFYSTDWLDEVTRTAYTKSSSLAISGGSPTFSYRGSLNYDDRQGSVKYTGFKRLAARINLDQKALDNRLNVQYSLSYTTRNQNDFDGGVLANAITYLPTLPVRNADGSFYEIPGSFSLFNPVAMQANERNDSEYNNLLGGVNLRYEVLPGLSLGMNGAYKKETNWYGNSRLSGSAAFKSANTRASQGYGKTDNKLLELTATYLKSFGDDGSNNFSILGGYSYQDDISSGFSALNRAFLPTTFGYDNLGAGGGQLSLPGSDYVGSGRSKWTLASFFGRGTLNLKNRYNLTATIRRDGSSKFGENNKWAIFPSVAGGWSISDESFFPKSNAFNYLKLRVSWGQTGNSEGLSPYQTKKLLGSSDQWFDGATGTFQPGYGISQNANPNLKWEVVQQTNLGLDFQFVNGRFSGSLDIYDKRTKDMLYPYNVPLDGVKYFTSSIWANVGSMSNKGIELSFGGDVIQKDHFSWNSRLVGSFNKNKIVSLSAGEFNSGVVYYNDFGGRGLSNTFSSVMEVGKPLGLFNNVPHFVGFDDQGNMLMEGTKGGKITANDKADTPKLGYNYNPQPYITAAWINSFAYKKFDLSFQLRGVFGNYIMNNVRSNLSIPGSILETNMLKSIQEMPKNFSTNLMTDYWTEKAGYVRLDNWQLGYNLSWDSKYITGARIYVAGNNLFIITKYRGIDPELQVRGDLDYAKPRDIGMDKSGIYPKTRTFQLGVNLTF